MHGCQWSTVRFNVYSCLIFLPITYTIYKKTKKANHKFATCCAHPVWCVLSWLWHTWRIILNLRRLDLLCKTDFCLCLEFWGDIAKDFFWKTKYTGKFLDYNFDVTRGEIYIKCMEGATTNICYNVLDRNVHERKLGDKVAFYWSVYVICFNHSLHNYSVLSQDWCLLRICLDLSSDLLIQNVCNLHINLKIRGPSLRIGLLTVWYNPTFSILWCRCWNYSQHNSLSLFNVNKFRSQI